MKYFDFGTDGVSGHVCGPDARFGGWVVGAGSMVQPRNSCDHDGYFIF